MHPIQAYNTGLFEPYLILSVTLYTTPIIQAIMEHLMIDTEPRHSNTCIAIITTEQRDGINEWWQDLDRYPFLRQLLKPMEPQESLELPLCFFDIYSNMHSYSYHRAER